jgi:hypothetical protein
VSADPLADWWRHSIVIRRWKGAGAYGDDFAADETVLGFVQDGTKLVADGTGQQVASSAQVALPIGTAYVPVQSEVTLPPQFGERTSRVIVSAVGDGGGQPTPDHHLLSLQ